MIDLAPITSMALEFVFGLVAVFGAFVLNALRKKFNFDSEGVLNERLNEAIERGLMYANEKLVENNKSLTRSTENEFVAEAVNYVIKGVPKTIQHFGLTQERIKELVLSRVGGKTPEDNE